MYHYCWHWHNSLRHSIFQVNHECSNTWNCTEVGGASHVNKLLNKTYLNIVEEDISLLSRKPRMPSSRGARYSWMSFCKGMSDDSLVLFFLRLLEELFLLRRDEDEEAELSMALMWWNSRRTASRWSCSPRISSFTWFCWKMAIITANYKKKNWLELNTGFLYSQQCQ